VGGILRDALEDAETALNSISEQASIWSRICEVLEHFRIRSCLRPPFQGIFIEMLQRAMTTCLRNSPDEHHFELILNIHHVQSAGISTEVTFDTILKVFPLPSYQLGKITIQLTEFQEDDWSRDVLIPENWQSNDAALSRHYPSLPCFDVMFGQNLPSIPKYGCINDLVRALFPQTTSRGATRALFDQGWFDWEECNGQNCPLHRSAAAQRSTTETSNSTITTTSPLDLQTSP